MPKQFIEEKLNHFSIYLSHIGLLSGIDIPNFQKKFYELNSNSINPIEKIQEDPNLVSIYFRENLSNTIVSFYKSMPEDKQKLTALNLYMKYSLKQEELIKKPLLKLLHLYLNRYFSYFIKKMKIITKAQNMATISKIHNNNNIGINKNNSMLNLKHQNLNISVYPDNYLNPNTNKKNINSLNADSNTLNFNNNYLSNNINSNNNSKNYSTMCNFDNYKKNKDFLLKVIDNSMNFKTTTKKSTKNTGINTSNSYIKKNKSITSLLSHPSSKSRQKSKKENIDYLSKLSKSKTEHNLLPEKTTQYLKEKEEYEKNCTFKPKINNSYSFVYSNNYSYCSNNNFSSIDRLYLDNKNRMARREMESLKKNHYESKENTFTPKLITSYGNKLKQNFIERQKNFDETKDKNIKKLTDIAEDEFKQKFTFTPQINNTPSIANTSKNSNRKVPVYKRLYQDNQEKMQRQEERIKQEIENIKLKSNTSLFYSNNNASNLNSQNVSKNVDYKKIEELYNDYKNKKNRLKKTQKKVDLESGLTFEPEIISNNKKYYDRINPDFYQREKNFLQRQQNYIDTYKKYLEKKESKMQKKYTNEEKEIIYNNIVERLYKDGVEKYIQKKNSSNISLIDNTNFSYINENKNMNKNMNINYGYEKEPQQEYFGGQQFIVEKNNNNYFTISGDKNYNSTNVKMDFSKI